MKLSIKEKLQEKGITRYELAKRVGVTYPTIDNIYKGNSTSIKLDILEAICNELDCSPNEIFVSDDPQINRMLAYSKGFKKVSVSTNNDKSDTK